MFYDFIEIGTSNFDTLIEKADRTTQGISIEPLDFYLRDLPESEGCKKINAAISDREGEVIVYYPFPEKLAQYHLPPLLKGCNSIGQVHPTVIRHIEKNNLDLCEVVGSSTVSMLRLTTICAQYDVTGIYFLKVDTEGHEPVILNDF